MKVILLRDVARLGRKHDVKEVPDGHAHNYLVPRKLALPATVERLKRQADQQTSRETGVVARTESFSAFFAELEAEPIVIAVSANKQGRFFKGFHAADIAKMLSEKSGIAIDSAAVELEKPIKEIGQHSALVRVGDRQETVVFTFKPASET